MSAIASFCVLAKADFDKYCKMAHLVPYEPQPERTIMLRAVTPKEAKSPRFRKQQDHYRKLWEFRQEAGERPYEYEWSGYVLGELITWLKDARKIDLTEITLMERGDPGFCWFVFDETIKEKYLDQLKPAHFKTQDVLASQGQQNDRMTQRVLKEMASKLSKEEMKSFISALENEKQQRSKVQDLVAQGKAMKKALQHPRSRFESARARELWGHKRSN